jgi:hypothetical protein
MYGNQCNEHEKQILNNNHLKDHGTQLNLYNIIERLSSKETRRSSKSDLKKLIVLVQKLVRRKKEDEK